MRQTLFAVVIVLLLSGSSYADTTYVSGPITTNTTWNPAHSPYVVVGNALVMQNVTLTIQPGVRVLFDTLKALQVDGKLVARGTETDSIWFTSRRSSPSPGNWGYILFDNSSVDAVFDTAGNYQNGCVLEYCEMSYGGASLGGDGMVRLDQAHPYVAHSLVRRSSTHGVSGQALFARVRVSDCAIVDNKGGVSLEGGSSSIERCLVARNSVVGSGAGIRVISNASAISDCSVTDNRAGEHGGGIYVSRGSARINKCDLAGNTAGSDGGGIYVESGYDTIVGCTISRNSGARDGGGIWTHGEAFILDNIIHGNAATGGTGGGVHVHYGDLKQVEGNIIRANMAQQGGGVGVYYCDCNIRGNIISHNTASDTAGGVDIGDSPHPTEITGNVIADHFAFRRSGVSGEAPTGLRANAIVRNNSVGVGSAVRCVQGEESEFRYNTITGNAATSCIAIDCQRSFNYNNLFGDSVAYELENRNPQGTPNLDARYNWWGTVSEPQIQQKIYDWFDDASRGIVSYSPWSTMLWTSCPVSPPTGVQAQASGDTLVVVTWNDNPEPDLDGYIVHWGRTSDTLYPFPNHLDVGGATTCYIRDLSPGTYFVTVTAYDAGYDSTANLETTVVNECQTEGNESWYAEGVYVGVAGIDEGGVRVLPLKVELAGAVPNPCRRTARIAYALPGPMRVRISVIDIAGREAAGLIDRKEPAGRHEVRIDASRFANGVYFCRLQAGGETRTQKLVVQK